MRLLQINNYADVVGGAEIYALALTRELRARGHDVRFFGTSDRRAADTEAERVVQRARYDARLLFSDPEVRGALAETLERHRPDLVHLHNVFSLGLDVVETLVDSGVPIVQTVHDANLICANSWCVWADGTVCAGGIGAKCFQHRCQENYPFDAEVVLHTLLKHRSLLDGVDVTLSPSRYLADRMAHHGRRDVRHRPNFIEPIPTPAGIERAPKELVYIGRLGPEKGVGSLLAAMELVRERDPAVHLTLISGDALSEELAERAARLGNSLTVLGHVPRQELGRYYASATACVLPSIWCENAPLTVLECLAAGLPVLATRIGGIPELVEDGVTGFTFRARDPQHIADVILRFLALPATVRETMSAEMRRRSASHSVAEHVNAIEGVYGDLLRAPRARPERSVHHDEDFRAALAELCREKAHLAKLFADLQRQVQGGTLELVRGIARTLKLPKVLR